MSKFAGSSLPRTFVSFRYLQKGTHVNEEERTEKYLCDQDACPIVSPERGSPRNLHVPR